MTMSIMGRTTVIEKCAKEAFECSRCSIETYNIEKVK